MTSGRIFAAASAQEDEASFEHASADCVRCSGSAAVIEVAGGNCAAALRAKLKLQTDKAIRKIARLRMDALLH
jgi:hypothetical protein